MTTLTTLTFVLAVCAACIGVASDVSKNSTRVSSMGFDPESVKTCGLACMVKANHECGAIVHAIRRFKKNAGLPHADGDYRKALNETYQNSTCSAPCAAEASSDCRSKIRRVVEESCPIDYDDCADIQQSLQKAERDRDAYKATAAVEKRRADCAESRLQDAEAELDETEKTLNATVRRVEELSQSVADLQGQLNALSASCKEGDSQKQAAAAAADAHNELDRK